MLLAQDVLPRTPNLNCGSRLRCKRLICLPQSKTLVAPDLHREKKSTGKHDLIIRAVIPEGARGFLLGENPLQFACILSLQQIHETLLLFFSMEYYLRSEEVKN